MNEIKMKRLILPLFIAINTVSAFTIYPSSSGVITSTMSRGSIQQHNLLPHPHIKSIPSIGKSRSRRSTIYQKKMSTDKNNEEGDGSVFLENQKKLITEFTDREEVVQNIKKKYSKKASALVFETAYFSTLIFSLLWLLSPTFFTPLSYLLGATLGTFYCFGLTKYVSTLGGTIDDFVDAEGSGVGSARFAFLILLVVLVGKGRVSGLQEIPSIGGFFTYQIASLSQGLRDSGEED